MARACAKILAFLLAVAFVHASAASAMRQQTWELAAQIDAGRLMEDIRWLADDDRNGRLATTDAEDEVVSWIAKRFIDLGLTPFAAAGLESRIQPFPIQTSFYPWDHATGGACSASGVITLSGTGENVVAVLAGKIDVSPRQFVILGAHHDHLGPCGTSVRNGADDNATGVAAMLEVARILSEMGTRPDKWIVFIAFGAEEVQRLGSRAFARLLVANNLDRSSVVLNLDMLGACVGAPCFVTLFGDDLDNAAELVTAVTEASLSLGHPVVSAGSRLAWSDHISLAAYRIPAVTITASAVVSDIDPSFDPDSAADVVPDRSWIESMLRYHPNYHDSADVAEALDPIAVAELTKVALIAVSKLAGIDH
ncbi:M20/M25/M40 family metallo-hydrolase [Candidatus Bipolaricaulota bacterium]|nr:M20/M25/M40 family metallo-hydrolase [Candidatus Bipolaricaulota bacterium]